MIPDHPGVVIPLSQLPADHSANFYMAQRGSPAASSGSRSSQLGLSRFHREDLTAKKKATVVPGGIHRGSPPGTIIRHATLPRNGGPSG
jgi:hypothetical protein